jgi:hypothetical protein
VGLHLAAQPAQVQYRVDPPQQMIGWYHFFQIKLVEKTVLSTNRRTHHRPDPLAPDFRQGITTSRDVQKTFSTASAKSGHLGI